MRLALALLLALAALALSGCGSDAESVREDVQQRAERLRDQAERRYDRLRRRIREVLADIRKAVPEASRPAPTVRGRAGTTTIDAFLTEVLRSVDSYWTRTLTGSGLREPRVSYVWVPPGRRVLTGCRGVADDHAAFYCPADDTIYMGQRLAADLYNGIVEGLPGQEAGRGRAVGDFGVAYVVAHEYAHNVQHELGFYSLSPSTRVKGFELQADCMAGLWGNSVYRAGRLQPGDVEEAIGTALATGDFDRTSAQHHGTPDERRRAWLDGFESGEPARCRSYVPGV
jgi:predicted metalloprotease